MKKADKIFAIPENAQALKELKSRLLDAFDIEKMILYGSVARAGSPIPTCSFSQTSP